MSKGLDVYCVREADLEDAECQEQLLSALNEKGCELTALVYIGDRELMELAEQLFGVSSEMSLYVGPWAPDLEPVWWWGFWGWAVDERRVDRLLCIEEGRLQSYQASGRSQRDVGRVLELWNRVSDPCGNWSVEWFNAVGELGDLWRELPSPAALRQAIRVWQRYLDSVTQLGRVALLQPNVTSWDRCRDKASLSPLSALGIHGEVSEWRKQLKSIKQAYDVDESAIVPRGLRDIEALDERLTTQDERAKRATQNRLVLWSAMLFVQGNILRHTGLSGLSVVAFWRALELYYHKIAIDEHIIILDGEGRWMWFDAGNQTGEITAYKIIEELSARGIVLSPTGSRPGGMDTTSIRLVRNRSVWIHGFSCVDKDGAEKVEKAISQWIAAFEGSMPRWKSAVDRIGEIYSLPARIGASLRDCVWV